MKKKCANCVYHDDFTWACSNAESPHAADFTDDEDCCDMWEVSKEDVENE